jgi:hypothetical protein
MVCGWLQAAKLTRNTGSRNNAFVRMTSTTVAAPWGSRPLDGQVRVASGMLVEIECTSWSIQVFVRLDEVDLDLRSRFTLTS